MEDNLPLYIFCNPNNESEIVEILQGMNDLHEYEKDGIKWNRLWQRPQMSVDVKVDINNSKDFVRYTSNKKGSYGDLLDASKEWSEKRKGNSDLDHVKEKYYEDYSKTRKGKKHLDVKKRELKSKLDKAGFELDI